MTRRTCVLCVGAIAAAAGQADAQTSTERVASGLGSPLYATHAPGDTNRLFMLEQGSSGAARVKALQLPSGPVSTYLTITGLSTGGERGLLGLAFHPDFASNGYFYVYVSIPGGADHQSQVRRYTALGDPLTSALADPASLLPVLTFSQPFSNHNAGWMAFNPDVVGGEPRYLYIATGDGGSGGDPQNNAKDITNNLLGKMLRIDVDTDDFPADPNRNYAIPPTNPFVGVTGDDEIWAYGLRNPWRNSFDPSNGDLWIGDVGQGAREEINHQPASSSGSEDYGWRVMEANNCFDNSQTGGNPPCNDPSFTPPVYDYAHGFGSFQGNSVTGGYVYRGSVAQFEGLYFLGDFQSNNIWTIDPHAVSVPASVVRRNAELPPDVGSISGVASFGEDDAGELYIISYSNGNVFRVTTTSAQAVWNGDDSTAGAPGDGSTWSSANNWTRGGIVDTPFVTDDEVVFEAGSGMQTINLGGDRIAAGARFLDAYTLQGGTLSLLSGNVRVKPGITATIASDLVAETTNASIRKLDGGRLNLTGTTGQVVVLSGTLGGTGTIDDLSAPAGVVAPGTSAGILSVANDYTQHADAALEIELAGTTPGTGHDQLAVTGAATIGGTLDVVYDAFTASPGDEFVILTAGDVDGTFSAVDYPDAQAWEIEYTATDVTIRVPAPGACSPADLTTQGAGVGDPGFGVPDGLVTTVDIQFYVNAWVAGDLGVADVTTTGAGAGDPGFGVPDGQVTVVDIQYYVNLWVAGCP